MAETVAKTCFQVESSPEGFLDGIEVSLNVYNLGVLEVSGTRVLVVEDNEEVGSFTQQSPVD